MKGSMTDETSAAVAFAVNERIRETVKSLVDATAPLYQPDRRRQPSLIGSGVFLQVANERFLLTAAHVFDSAAPDVAISVATVSRITNLPGFRWRTSGSPTDGGVDRHDMAIVPLDPKEAYYGCRFLALDEIDPFQETEEEVASPAAYLVVGYPRTAQARQLTDGKLVPVACPFINRALPFSKYAQFNVEPASHLVVGYNRRDFFGISQEQRHPRGMSGGGIWRLDNLWSGQLSARLVAIVCEYHERPESAIVGTRVTSPILAIREKYEALRSVIDEHFPAASADETPAERARLR